MGEVAQLISQYGFPVVVRVGLGYFIYYVWKYINTEINPLGKMHMALIRVIDPNKDVGSRLNSFATKS